MEFIVKKLGWENASKLHKSASNIYSDYKKWKKQAIVVSAMRSEIFNTTTKLIEIWKKIALENIDKKDIFQNIKEIKDFHLKLLEDDLLCNKQKLINLINNIFDQFEDDIKYYIWQKNKKVVPSKDNDFSIETKDWKIISILWFGEYVSIKIISSVVDSFDTKKVCSKSVDLWNIINTWEFKNKSETETFYELADRISEVVLKKIDDKHIPILSWYIWVFENGIAGAIWRWYSDATAAIVSVGLKKRWYDVILEIQKSVKWLLSADPRLLDDPKDAKLLPKVDYLIAREITGENGAQAKLLHPQSLRTEVQHAGIKIYLFDPFSENEWTWVLDKVQENQKCAWIDFIWARKNIVFCTLSSGKMFEKNILSKLFTIVWKYFAVDIVSTSETEISFTVDWAWNIDPKLDNMTKEIQKTFDLPNDEHEFIKYEKNNALLFCVWAYMKDCIWIMKDVVSVLWENNINIKIASQWILQRSMVFWIEEKDLKKAVNLLHKKFILWKKI